MKYAKIISTNINAQHRLLTHQAYKGVTGVNEVLADFGVDAAPYPGIMAAIVSATTSGRGAVHGFFNKYNVAIDGERRTYSTKPDGSEQVSEIYQLNDGSILIRGGIEGGAEKYAMLIDPDGNITESFGLKTMTGDVVINGSLTVNGDLVGGTIKTAAGIDSDEHIHGYLDDGVPSLTDPPQ